MGHLALSSTALLADEENSAHSDKTSCFSDAKSKAKTLLDFYRSSDPRAAVGEPKERPSIKSPDGKRKYRVIEVPGFIYKGEYRIRLIYATLSDDPCLLMGEEILDLSRL